MNFLMFREDEFSALLHECKDPAELNQLLSSAIQQKDEAERKLKGILGQRANKPANQKQRRLEGDYVKLTQFTDFVSDRIKLLSSPALVRQGA